MKKFMIVAGLALAAVSAANADVKLSFAGPITFGNGTTGPQNLSFTTTPLVGTLTGVVVSFTWSGAVGASWASDFFVGVGAPQSIYWGGFSTLTGVKQSALVGLPETGANGTYSGTGSGGNGPFPTYNNTTAIINYGNGWTGNGGFTVTDLSITLKGVDKIPAPGAMALLGLAGFAARRRRA